MRSILASLCVASVAAAPTLAQSVIVPAANATARGVSGLNTLTRGTANPRTYMLGIAAANLAAIPNGAVITGVSFRSSVTASNLASWPAADTNWADYEVTLGNAIPLASWTGNFPSNFAGTPVQVRDGSMTIATGTFANNAALPVPQANPFADFFWDFQTTFVYTGGDLAILFTHPGSNSASAEFIDYAAVNAASHVAFSASAFQATTGGAAASFCIPRIHYGYGTGCPGTGGITPVLNQTGNVAGAGAVGFHIVSGPANAPALYVIGSTQISAPLPGGCTLLTNPILFVPLALDQYGRCAFAASFPAGTSLTAYVQGFVIDIGVPSLFTATNGVSLTVTP